MMPSMLRVLLIGGTADMRVVVRDALGQTIHLMASSASGASDTARLLLPDVAVLLHPEAKELVASIHSVCPVVVVTPEEEILAQEYLASGVEDLVFDSEVANPGYLLRRVKWAVGRRQARRALEQEARIDPLTELLNRRGIDELLSRMVQARHSAGVIALLVDLDDFKQINESRGMAGGDEVLRVVADLLRANARPTDLVARIGGDEFLVVLPGADRAAGDTVSERMRRAIESQDGVTASFGLARVEVGVATVADLILQTQQCLRSSKSRGKNRIVSASEVGLPPIRAVG